MWWAAEYVIQSLTDRKWAFFSLQRLKRCYSVTVCSSVTGFLTCNIIIDLCNKTDMGKLGNCNRNTEDRLHVRRVKKKKKNAHRFHAVLWILKQGWDTHKIQTPLSGIFHSTLTQTQTYSMDLHILAAFSSWPPRRCECTTLEEWWVIFCPTATCVTRLSKH